MNNLSRVVTGIVIIVLSVLFILGVGFAEEQIIYSAVATGLLFAILGLVIIFNKKEDQIEEIKDNQLDQNNN